MSKTLNAALFGLIILSAALFLAVSFEQTTAEASIVTGEEYTATTTNATTAAVRTLKFSGGALGMVTITGANTGTMTFYNATTSDISKRTGNKATSTIIIADFPASAAAGTYTFDATFSDGLLFSSTGLPATSSIMYR